MDIRNIDLNSTTVGDWLVAVANKEGVPKAVQYERIIKERILDDPEANLATLTFAAIKVGGESGYPLTPDIVFGLAQQEKENDPLSTVETPIPVTRAS